MWEDRVFHDPDGVDADALFEDLQSDDQRTQYEAAAGVYWLAHFRPERVSPRAEELLDLLGNLPDFALGSGDPRPKEAMWGSGTRNWATDAVAELAVAYPEQFVPQIIECLDADSERLREDATLVLGATYGSANAADYFDHLCEHRFVLAELIDDANQTVRNGALSALAGLADEHPEAVIEFVPRVALFLDRSTPDTSAVIFLNRVATELPESVAPAVEPLVETLSRLDSENVQTSMHALEALLALAEEYPEQVSAAESDVARFARTEYESVSQPAIELLRELRE